MIAPNLSLGTVYLQEGGALGMGATKVTVGRCISANGVVAGEAKVLMRSATAGL